MYDYSFETDDNCYINDITTYRAPYYNNLPENNNNDPQPHIKPPPINYWGFCRKKSQMTNGPSAIPTTLNPSFPLYCQGAGFASLSKIC
mmetsp:Transcript_34580/g.41362  ORF Transcript_34580/g.41362 Transcript_34580/m.41362 type:complete len:89 (+) Transcript_34580:332-598(+)